MTREPGKIQGRLQGKLENLSKGQAKLLGLLLQRQGKPAREIEIAGRGDGAHSVRLPTSGIQQRLWFIDQLEGGSHAYHLPAAIRLRGDLDVAVLQAALDALVRRHETLRTVFVQVDGAPVQEIRPDSHLALQIFDLSRDEVDAREAAVLSHSRDEVAAPFDLTLGPLIRARLLKLALDEHVLVIVMHHIISDGWSIAVLIRELAAMYETLRDGRGEPLPPLPIQYADYALWQRKWLQGAEMQEQVRYWTEHLQHAPELLELPLDRPRPPLQSYRGAVVRVELPDGLAAGIKALSRRLGLTLAMTLYGAWAIVLSRLSGQDDVVIGMPVANRRRTEFEGLIGCFVNTLAMRVQLANDPTIAEFLQRVKQVLLGGYTRQDAAFEQIVEALQPERSLSHSPIFQTMFVLQTASHATMQPGGLTLMEQELPLHTAQFDLMLALQDSPEGLRGRINYATDLFDADTIQRWGGYLESVLRGMVRDTHLRISGLPLMGPDERRHILESFNDTAVAIPKEKLIHQLFEEQVTRTPDAIAVTSANQALSYAELNARANQLAHYLRERGAGPDQLVGICTERSVEMVIGLLGILKAGAAYVPMDPGYPPERLRHMQQDAAPRVLLLQGRLREKMPDTTVEVIALDEDWSIIAQQPSSNPDPHAVGLRSDHLAYVIYTSGSTGKPKGAMNEHRALINRLQWMQDQYQLSGSDRVLQKTPFSFDVSVWEFFWTLMSGAQLVMARPEGHKDPQYLRALIEDVGVTTLHFVPSMLQAFLDDLEPGRCTSLRRIVCSGEELPAALQNKCLRLLPGASLGNLYGPTEAAVDVTYWECVLDDHAVRVPIGRPIANIQMYILDQRGEPVPTGVTGEVYIGGVGVGRGYWNRPELTAQRFVTDKFGTAPDARLYKTGDLGRWRADGAIEYLGRNDYQVKIRGFRIELGEIDAQLARHPSVHEAAVIAREDVPGSKRLVAYVVLRAASGPASVSELRDHLKASLPDYMVPSAFVMLERMPLSANGKLDRRALPRPELDAFSRRVYEAPAGETEEIVAGIWRDLLRLEQVGRHDNFFELGGHSLLIVQMRERLRRAGLSSELRRVFESPSLAALASVLGHEELPAVEIPPNLIPPACEAIAPDMLTLVALEQQHIDRIVASVPGGATNIEDIYPLAPLQEGVLFHHLLHAAGGDTYVLSIALSVASRQRLEEVIAALQTVIDRHDVLRTAVLWELLPRPVQVVYRKASLPVDEVALAPNVDTIVQVREWLDPQRQRLDLQQAPLIRLRVATDSRGECYALLQLHHICMDHVTLEIVTAEVVAILNGKIQSPPQSFPYRHHIAQALAYASKHDAETFFRSKLADVDEPTAPFGLTDVYGDGSKVTEAHEALDSALAGRIRAQARRLGVSPATVFHAAWAMVVGRTSARDDVVFGTVLLGRLHGNSHGQRTLGMFINTLPVRLRLKNVTARDLIEQARHEMVELLSHEQASLAAAQRCSGISGSAPLFSALLNYRHSAPNPQGEWAGADGIRVLASQERTNYPIVISVDDLEHGFRLAAQADQRIDPQRIVGYLRTAVQSLIDALEQAPQTPVLTLAILPRSERCQVIEQFNDTAAVYPREQLSHELFEVQVRQTPDAAAVVYGEQSMTYGQLNAMSNQLARYLTSRGLTPGEYVPVHMSRSLRMLIAHIAVLKSGAVYVPVDPEMPVARRAFIMNDCAARWVLSEGDLPAELALDGVQWVDCTEIEEACRHLADSDLQLHGDSSGPAYVMYTSGSTGEPKGVVVPHRAINKLVVNNGFIEAGPSDCIVHYSNPAFDASTIEIWLTLSSGAKLVIVPQAVVLDAKRFAAVLRQQHVTALYMSVGLFNQYADAMTEVFADLRYLMVGGDSLEPGAIRRVLQRNAPRALLNVYGPTECTTISTTYLIPSVEEGETSIPIGRPISNTQIYILDQSEQPVPVGVAGEIYIGGAGVACGYLNRAELTVQRFIADPFSADTKARMYRTGDVGRWRDDGTIEFLGRNDHQVKIRGFRIELGEIETRLLGHADIKEATVLARQDAPGEKRLVGYVVPVDPSHAPSSDDLRALLRSALPEYMIPSAFMLLPSMPLTPTGKVDRRALPAPEHNVAVGRPYEAPQDEIEDILAGIWQGLLRVERVGRHDNFFELGGHSLLIVQMMERLRRVGLSTDVRRVFSCPTLADLAGTVANETVEQVAVPSNLIPEGATLITPRMLPLVELEAEHIEHIVQRVPGGARNIQDIYPLAPLQEGILFHHLLDEKRGDVYVLTLSMSVASQQRLDEFIEALQRVIDRHDVLRTSVQWEHLPRPVQVVQRTATLPVEQIPLDPTRDSLQQLEEWLEPARQRLDLCTAPLIRLKVAAEESSGQRHALLQLHHIVVDGQSLKIVTGEVAAFLQGQARQLPNAMPYRNHVAQALAYARKHDAESFFKERFADVDEPTAPFGLLDVHGDGSQIEEAHLEFAPDLSERIHVQARRHGVSAATLFHAAWGVVVAHTTSRSDVVFGSVLLGRMQGTAGAQRVLGMFINTLPLRLKMQGLGVKQLVEHTQRELVELFGHEQASLAMAQNCSGLSGQTPLFSSLLNYRHGVRSTESGWINAEGITVRSSRGLTNYPITISVDDWGNALSMTAQTDRRIDPNRIARYLHRAVQSLVEALERSAETPALSLAIMPDDERHSVIELFNATYAAYPQGKRVHGLFEAQAALTPDAIAAVYEEQSITYAELDARANQLAHYLNERGVGRDRLVGICLERGLEMVVGLLGALKAGGAYLPLDPGYPIERLQYMVEDADPLVVLTQKNLRAVLPDLGDRIIELDASWNEIAAYAAHELPALAPDSADLVYVIYTSGSTGRPKGTAMSHGAMVNLIEWHRATLCGPRAARVLQFAALSFDVAFQETFSTLCTGGTLVLLHEALRRDARALLEFLGKERINRLFVPPLMLQSLAEFSQGEGTVRLYLRDVITAGEQLRISPEIIAFFARLPGCRLHNHYGPTETHVVTALTLSDTPDQWPVLPAIGAPIANSRIYILDGQSQPVPLGVTGEVYIGGAGVARGYRGQPELTAQRFLVDPFSADPQARMYKTGDLGRWRTDGTIEYLGRNDDQVKIRGYRIELGEIEAQLAGLQEVREAAVIAREDTSGGKRLIAYVTPRGRFRPSAEQLRARLNVLLPEYMVPSAFVMLESLPLTPSGKLNRRALPAPGFESYADAEYEAPQAGVEQALAAIWSDILKVERIGRGDNFFDLGGHSLLVLKALFKIERELGRSLKVTDIYRSPTLRELAAHLQGSVREEGLVDLEQEARLSEEIVANPGPRRRLEQAVLLTGATGFVGRFLLSQLLHDTHATVYCLVRSESQQQAEFRVRTTLANWDLWRDEFEPRIIAIAGDLRLPRLGLDARYYREVAKNVDTIYHCATSMNHLETYAMAKVANVESSRALLELATRERPKLINYISTLGVFAAPEARSTRIVDETTPIEHEKHSTASGYVASKWVAEKMFMTAVTRGIPCNIFRLGLVWGDTHLGRFDELQNVYRVLKSCLLSGYGIEGYRYWMAPTPVDYVTRTIVFLSGQHSDGGGIFHISSSKQAIDGVFERCNELVHTGLELLPLYQWIGEMKRLHLHGHSLPVVPLIEYAFSMDEATFSESQRRFVATRFECIKTHQELERAGIVAPILDDDLLAVCVRSMLLRDPELRKLMEDRDSLQLGKLLANSRFNVSGRW